MEPDMEQEWTMPVVGGSLLLDPTTKHDNPLLRQQASELADALVKYGCCVLEANAPASPILQGIVSSSRVYEQFFKASSSVKTRNKCYKTPLGKELLEFQYNANPPADTAEDQASEEVFGHLDRLSRHLLACLPLSSHLSSHPEVSAERLLEVCDPTPLPPSHTSSSVLHVSNYPQGASSSSHACAPHLDRGLLTLVMSDQVHGLQVQSGDERELAYGGGGSWVDVPLGPGRVAVMAGYTLAHALAGRVQPCVHRINMRESGTSVEDDQTRVEASGSKHRGSRNPITKLVKKLWPRVPRSSGDVTPDARISVAFKLRGRPEAVVDVRYICGMPHAPSLSDAPAVDGKAGMTVEQLMERCSQDNPQSVNGLGRFVPRPVARPHGTIWLRPGMCD